MPGTIQVSVLEFKSSSSSSTSASISLNVSLGKKEYQTLDKGDFHFPLTTLRDDLIVTLYDADGNKLAHTGVRTMSIVEKGSWDDIFPFEEGGHVHMKLQFSLSEEDRNRIRTMRETAMKKKTPGNANLSFTGKEVIDLLGQSDAKTHLEADGSLPAKVKRGSFWGGADKKRIDMSGSSPDDANGGLVGQVIKIAVIVGFGILVLLTRQREPRKSRKAAKYDFYSNQDFMDEQHDIN